MITALTIIICFIIVSFTVLKGMDKSIKHYQKVIELKKNKFLCE